MQQQTPRADFVQTPPAPAATTYKLNDVMAADLERRFTYHTPKGDQPARYVALRSGARHHHMIRADPCLPGEQGQAAAGVADGRGDWARVSDCRTDSAQHTRPYGAQRSDEWVFRIDDIGATGQRRRGLLDVAYAHEQSHRATILLARLNLFIW